MKKITIFVLKFNKKKTGEKTKSLLLFPLTSHYNAIILEAIDMLLQIPPNNNYRNFLRYLLHEVYLINDTCIFK